MNIPQERALKVLRETIDQAELSGSQRSLGLLAIGTLTGILEELSPSADRPKNSWDLLQDILNQCKIDGVIQLEQLKSAYRRITPDSYGSKTSSIKSKLERMIEQVTLFGEDSIVNLRISTRVFDVLLRSAIFRISELNERKNKGHFSKIRQLGVIGAEELTNALQKFNESHPVAATLVLQTEHPAQLDYSQQEYVSGFNSLV